MTIRTVLLASASAATNAACEPEVGCGEARRAPILLSCDCRRRLSWSVLKPAGLVSVVIRWASTGLCCMSFKASKPFAKMLAQAAEPEGSCHTPNDRAA